MWALAIREWIAGESDWLIPAAVLGAFVLSVTLKAAIPALRAALGRWRARRAWRADVDALVEIRSDLARLVRSVGENGGQSLHERLDRLEERDEALDIRLRMVERRLSIED